MMTPIDSLMKTKAGRGPKHLLLIAAIGLFALVLAGCDLLPEERVEEVPTLLEPPPSRTVAYPVERGLIVEEIRGLARVSPTLETNLYFTQSGRVFEVNVEPGDRVSKGDVLIRLETGDLEHQLRLAEIDLQAARLRLERMRTQAAPMDIQLEELALNKSELQVNHLRQRLEAAMLRAPHDGVVQIVRTRVGELVEEYATLAVVADPAELVLQIEIRRDDEINKLTRGQRAMVETSRNHWEQGSVIQITAADDNPSSFSRARLVHIGLDNEEAAAQLNLNDLVSTRIAVQERDDALIIPRAALREFMGRTYVRVLEGDARREVDVEVGIRTPTEVEILSGLDEGDMVIGQ